MLYKNIAFPNGVCICTYGYSTISDHECFKWHMELAGSVLVNNGDLVVLIDRGVIPCQGKARYGMFRPEHSV